jgi:hypothetical protein
VDAFENRPDVPLIDRVKIQAEVLVPLIKSLEKELGTERARHLVREVLADSSRARGSALVAERGSLGAIEAIGKGLWGRQRHRHRDARDVNGTIGG